MTSNDRDLPEGEARGSFKPPTHYIAAVIDDEGEFRAAIDEVVTAGIPMESIGLLSGQRGVEAFANRPRGVLEGLLGDEPEHLARYEDEVRAGSHVLAVALPDGHAQTQDRIRGLLKARGARQLLTSGRWTHSVEE